MKTKIIKIEESSDTGLEKATLLLEFKFVYNTFRALKRLYSVKHNDIGIIQISQELNGAWIGVLASAVGKQSIIITEEKQDFNAALDTLVRTTFSYENKGETTIFELFNIEAHIPDFSKQKVSTKPKAKPKQKSPKQKQTSQSPKKKSQRAKNQMPAPIPIPISAISRPKKQPQRKFQIPQEDKDPIIYDSLGECKHGMKVESCPECSSWGTSYSSRWDD